MENNLTIKEISNSELAEVVNIHVHALPEDVLPSLGKNILTKYYNNIINDRSQKLFGVYLTGKMMGFCLVSTSRAGIGAVIATKQGLIAVIKLMLFKPKIFYIGLMQAFKRFETVDDAAEISFIAVSPNYQGQGAGKEMLIYANKWCRESGITFIQTKTANQSLRSFYLKKFSAEEVRKYRLVDRCYSELKWSTSQSTANPCLV